MGLPGTLPVVNGEAVRLATMAALSLGCTVTEYTRFDRKNYFYPDLPKAYQISQLYFPLGRNGSVTLDMGEAGEKQIRIHEMHMEEDAGKLIHDATRQESYPDYNRCGVPLIEIVSEPDFRNAQEVSAYLERLCAMFRYAGISDCKMQEGSLRADVNISVRPMGETRLGTRTELKNLNSMKAISRAIAYESARQIRVLEQGGTIEQETRRWDDGAGVSLAMRSKEDAQDYRYFPEPDIPPLHIPRERVEELRIALPEFAHEREVRLCREYGLSRYDAGILCGARTFADLFEETVRVGVDAKECANWLLGPIRKQLHDAGAAEEAIRLSPQALATVLMRVAQKKINRASAILLVEEFLLCGGIDGSDVDRLIMERGFAQIGDSDAIEATVREVLETNPAAVEDYLAGKKRAEGFLIGQTMKALGGRADPAAVKTAVGEALKQMISKV
jgi:aspartyl-tRNA(Asn)/glutamyl-tRNA(Gln) amidotransferase subunit B